MGLADKNAETESTRGYIRDHTLIRRIENFELDEVIWQTPANLSGDNTNLTFTLSKRQLPDPIPADWQVETIDARQVRVTCTESLSTLLPVKRLLGFRAPGKCRQGLTRANSTQVATIHAAWK